MINSLQSWKNWAAKFPQQAEDKTPYVSPFRIVNKGTAKEPAEILIYDQIGRDFWSGEGMAAKDFAEILKELSPDAELIVGINSPGGNVWDGLSIFNQLSTRKGKVTTRNDGMAASIASVILQAGSERQSHESAMVMIHRAWGMMIGNAADAEAFKKDLEKHDQVISSLYAKRSGKPEAGFVDAMAAETIYTGAEAKTAGLVDSLIASGNAAATASNIPVAATVPTVQAAVAAINNLATPAKPVHTGNQEKDKTMETNTTPAPVAATPPAPDATIIALQSSLDTIKAQLDKERKDRIERTVHGLVLENKLTATETAPAIARALKDESYLAELAARPATITGTSPLNGMAETISETGPLAEVKKHKTAKSRFDFMKNNWQDLRNSIPRSPQMANTVDSALVTQMLLDGTTTVLQNRLAPLRAVSLQFEVDRIKPLAVLQHRKVTAGGTAQTNATSFEDTTNFVGTNDNVQISPAQITSGGHCTNAERQSGHALAQWTTVKVAEFSDAIMGLFAAKVLVATYTATPVTSAAAAFGMAELKTLWGQLKKSPIKNLILDGEYYAQLLPATLDNYDVTRTGIPGWDEVVLNTVWTGATANTVGLALNPQAMACGMGLPIRDPQANEVSTEQIVSLPDLGISVAVTNWYSNITRASWITWDIMAGFAANDTTAAVMIKSA